MHTARPEDDQIAVVDLPPTMPKSNSLLDQVLTHRCEANKDIVDVDEPVIKLVIFEISGQRFAFNGDSIREILAGAEVFFVPGCPASLEGVINVRGDIESVIHLNALLNLPAQDSTQSSILLGRSSIASGSISSGIRVERVIDVIDVPQSRIQAPPSVMPEALRSYVIGVLEFEAAGVALLDIDPLFTDYTRSLG
jgi:purine-binding chemotaxis protein CheW